MQHRVGEFRSRAKDSAVRIRKVDHELSPQVNTLPSGPAISQVAQIASGDESSQRHSAWRKGFPGSAACGGGESVSALTELTEVLAIDFWSTLEGLEEHYSDATAVSGLDDVLAGPPTASVWEQVSGFSEW